MVGRAALVALAFSAILCACGHREGNAPLGVTGGGENGYGGFGTEGVPSPPDVQTLLGTWRDNLDSPNYTQYRFDTGGIFEIWSYSGDYHFHAFGTYTVGDSYPQFLRIFVQNEVIFSGPFWFEGEDLVLGGLGGNLVFHRVG